MISVRFSPAKGSRPVRIQQRITLSAQRSVPEVEHVHGGDPARALGQEDALWLEVAVHDAGGVRLGDRLARLEDVEGGLLDRKPASALDLRAEIHPGGVLHHDVRRAVGELADVVHLRDVLALEVRRRAPLADEARNELGVVQAVGAHELNGARFEQVDVRGCHDDAHAANAEHALHPILAREEASARYSRGVRAGEVGDLRSPVNFDRRVAERPPKSNHPRRRRRAQASAMASSTSTPTGQ
jgi:hypothetical protein